MNQITELVTTVAKAAKRAAYQLATINTIEKNQALKAMADSIDEHRSVIKSENALDIKQAYENKLSPALIDRLTLNDKRIDEMLSGIRTVANLADPIGKLITSRTLENDIDLRKVRVPIGVIGIIFESRPNVVADVAALCLKSGNAVILRGGSESEHSNRAIMNAISAGLNKIAFTPFAVQMMPIKDRAAVSELCRMNRYVDLIIPRGGEGLIKAVMDSASVPVLKHYKGICAIYVDESADEEMALNICQNAKCQRPSACNAAETILVHEKIAESFLSKLASLFKESRVEIRGDEQVCAIIKDAKLAQVSDWDEEFLDMVIAIKIVKSCEEAINHINTHGSHHSDAIISASRDNQHRFVLEVDSAAVYVNASTRFTDGNLFGLGAEMGISTDKLHARGPMGLAELTTYKWVAYGNGQIRH